MQISEAAGGVPTTGSEPCRFPKLEECAHFHYERVQLPQLTFSLQTNMDQSLHSQHTNDDDGIDWHMVQVTSANECWLVQRNYENFKMLDAQLHQCIFDRKISQLPDLSSHPSYGEDVEMLLMEYLARLSTIADNSVNCGPVLNWFQMDNKGHRLLVPSEESRSINTPAVAAAYSVRRYVSQARDELNLEVGDMISVIDMASPAESMWWRGKRGFQVGFFPQHCVHIIGDKVPRNMPLPPPVVGSLAITPVKPVLRKHGKLIAFFRSFILNRPSRRRLKQSGILKERVFGCDLGEHLLNSGHDIPTVLKCCTEFIEKHGIVDGIYRLSGITSNIQKLRNAFDEDRIPDLYTDEILQDIHSVASLLKMYFRELPNPLCTYQLYQSFVTAVQGCSSINRNSCSDRDRLLKMREAVQKLPPPHYRTLEYLMRHLSRVALHGASTGMTTRNIAIVWAPNLLRCAELEIGGVAALQGVGVQAVVTEFLICYADLIFCDHLPSLNNASFEADSSLSPKRCRPKSLAISTPTKLITLEEARTKHLMSKADDNGYIEVGGGPNNLPKKYHTVIELPSGSRKRGLSKRSPLGWRSFFSKSRNSSRSQGSLTKTRKASTPGNISAESSAAETDLAEMKRKLRPVKSAESLTSGHSEPVSCEDVLGPLHCLNKPPGHNRSVSHDSYFDTLQPSQHNSEGSLYDLSEIQLNFELEESEMRIFSEDESLVSSPRVHKDSAHRRILTRARPEDFSSTNNSNNPSPKKQARVVLSPDSYSRKRTRLEDQLSDIQYIDCNTPDNTCVISTTAVVHPQPEVIHIESYQPKNKSPRSSEVESKHQSLDLDKADKISIPKSFTESNINVRGTSNNSSMFPSPQSPMYKKLENSSSNTTLLSPDFSPATEVGYQNLNYASDDNDKKYENVVSPVSKKSSPTYENILTTISITYRSPTKSPKNLSEINDSVYEDVIVNPEQAVVPTSAASLPLQQASQPDFLKENPSSLPVIFLRTEKHDSRPKSMSAIEDLHFGELKPKLSPFLKGEQSAHSLLSGPSPTASYKAMENTISDLSLSEVIHSSTENFSHSSISFPVSPSKNSLSPNVSPMLFGEDAKTLSQDILTSLSPSVASLLESKTRHSSGSSFDGHSEENANVSSLRNDVLHGNLEYLKLTDNNISSNEEDISPVRFRHGEKPLFRESPLFNVNLPKEDFELRSESRASSELHLLDTPKSDLEPLEPLSLSLGQLSDANKDTTEDIPEIPLETTPAVTISTDNNMDRPSELQLDSLRPTSINLIEFSPNEPPIESLNRASVNDKRKSCETESLDDENSIYQQVKYFRRSIHEINALLDLDDPNNQANEDSPPQNTTNNEDTTIDATLDKDSETFDSLEVDNIHVYENVENPPCTQNTEDTKLDSLNIGSDCLVSIESLNINSGDSETQNSDSSKSSNLLDLQTSENLDLEPQSYDVEPSTVELEQQEISVMPEIVEVPKAKPLGEVPEKLNVRSLTSHFELKETSQKPPIYRRSDESAKRNDDSAGARNQKSHSARSYREGIAKNENRKDSEIQTGSRDLQSTKSDYGSISSLESDKVQRIIYERGSLPPCLRARQVKNAIKTRSLDEDAFIKEFGVVQERRKSVDESLGTKLNTLPKVLNPPKPIPIEGQKLDIHLAHSSDNILISLPEQKLNRERIEKYKEERRKFLHDKYRSESFKEDKDIFISRLKQKTKTKVEDDKVRKPKSDANEFDKDSLECDTNIKVDKSSTCRRKSGDDFSQLSSSLSGDFPIKDSIRYKTALFESQANQSKKLDDNKVKKAQQSPVSGKKNPKESENVDVLSEGEFVQSRRKDEENAKSERRRHTYGLKERERESEAERARRISLDSKSPRKEAKSPSYCIKDMKAIFESKSKQ